MCLSSLPTIQPGVVFAMSVRPSTVSRVLSFQMFPLRSTLPFLPPGLKTTKKDTRANSHGLLLAPAPPPSSPPGHMGGTLQRTRYSTLRFSADSIRTLLPSSFPAGTQNVHSHCHCYCSALFSPFAGTCVHKHTYAQAHTHYTHAHSIARQGCNAASKPQSHGTAEKRARIPFAFTSTRPPAAVRFALALSAVSKQPRKHTPKKNLPAHTHTGTARESTSEWRHTRTAQQHTENSAHARTHTPEHTEQGRANTHTHTRHALTHARALTTHYGGRKGRSLRSGLSVHPFRPTKPGGGGGRD